MLWVGTGTYQKSRAFEKSTHTHTHTLRCSMLVVENCNCLVFKLIDTLSVYIIYEFTKIRIQKSTIHLIQWMCVHVWYGAPKFETTAKYSNANTDIAECIKRIWWIDKCLRCLFFCWVWYAPETTPFLFLLQQFYTQLHGVHGTRYRHRQRDTCDVPITRNYCLHSKEKSYLVPIW